MLTRLRINGFKNLVGIDLHFGPFTCIAGANGVGKSNLFDAIQFLRALMEHPVMDAAMAIRDEAGSVSDIKHLFTHRANGQPLAIELEAEMLIPEAGYDYLDQPAEAKTTFLIYGLTLKFRPEDSENHRPRIEISEERLDYVKKTNAHSHLPFRHTTRWRNSVIKGRRTSPYLSTETETDDGNHIIKLHQDSSTGGGRTRHFQAQKLPRTVLSTVNAQESPTAVLARQEILNWNLLQLEPSALRAPDGFDAPSRITPQGRHLPSTLFRLSQTVQGSALTEIANRLSELIEKVGRVSIDRDKKREIMTLLLTDQHGTELPAKSLSDGTLRFIALASVEIDSTLTGLLCMEEPENGIHPQRIGALLDLLRDIAVDPELEIDDDNPLRQVIINTHSPIVVKQIPEDALIFAISESQMFAGKVIRGVGFRCLSDTWRADTVDMKIIPKGKALGFLNPVSNRDSVPNSEKVQRVIDRDDLRSSQINMDF